MEKALQGVSCRINDCNFDHSWSNHHTNETNPRYYRAFAGGSQATRTGQRLETLAEDLVLLMPPNQRHKLSAKASKKAVKIIKGTNILL